MSMTFDENRLRSGPDRGKLRLTMTWTIDAGEEDVPFMLDPSNVRAVTSE